MASFWKQQGYVTALAGVQHEKNFWRPYEQGVAAGKLLGYMENLSVSDAFVRDDNDLLEWDYQNAEQVADFLTAYDQKQPFFLSYGTHATHRVYPDLTAAEQQLYNANYVMVPDDVQNNAENRLDTARLHKSLASYDRCFGHVINSLKAAGLYEKTIVVYTTDHGLPNPYGKCGLRDTGMAVSFLMRVPQYPASHGQVYDGILSHLDLLPTLCRLTGREIPDYVQGIDFSKIFTDPKTEIRTEIYAEVNFHASYEPQRCIRTERYKFIRYFDPEWDKFNPANCDESVIKSAMLANGLTMRTKASEQLYDLLFDPKEKDNLIDNPAYAKIKQDLNSRLQQWMTATSDHVMRFEEYSGRYKVNRRECLTASTVNPEDYESVMES